MIIYVAIAGAMKRSRSWCHKKLMQIIHPHEPNAWMRGMRSNTSSQDVQKTLLHLLSIKLKILTQSHRSCKDRNIALALKSKNLSSITLKETGNTAGSANNIVSQIMHKNTAKKRRSNCRCILFCDLYNSVICIYNLLFFFQRNKFIFPSPPCNSQSPTSYPKMIKIKGYQRISTYIVLIL